MTQLCSSNANDGAGRQVDVDDDIVLTEASSIIPVRAVPEGPIVADDAGLQTADNHNRWLAVAAVLALAWFPYVAVCLLYEVYSDDSSAWPFAAEHLWELIQHVSIIAVILYVMYRVGRPWSAFGIERFRLFYDTGLGVLLFFGTYLVLGQFYFIGELFAGSEEMERFSTPDFAFPEPLAAADYVVLILVSLSIGMSEEIAMRGYLLPTLERLLGSTAWSVFATSLLFASYHLYQGAGPAVWIFVLGLVFGCAFCWMRRLWPLVLAHAAMDVVDLWPGLWPGE